MWNWMEEFEKLIKEHTPAVLLLITLATLWRTGMLIATGKIRNIEGITEIACWLCSMLFLSYGWDIAKAIIQIFNR